MSTIFQFLTYAKTNYLPVWRGEDAQHSQPLGKRKLKTTVRYTSQKTTRMPTMKNTDDKKC